MDHATVLELPVDDRLSTARHDNDRGIVWRLDHPVGTFELRDDGFGPHQWTRITMAINGGLAPHGIAAEKASIAKLFDS